MVQPADHIDGRLRYATLVNGHNERLHVDDLEYGTRFLYDLVIRTCT